MARARVELLSAAIEAAIANVGAVKLGARLVEAATVQAVRKPNSGHLSASILALWPSCEPSRRAHDLNVALLHQIAPELPRVLAVLFDELGHGDQTRELTQRFVALLRAPEQEDQ